MRSIYVFFDEFFFDNFDAREREKMRGRGDEEEITWILSKNPWNYQDL